MVYIIDPMLACWLPESWYLSYQFTIVLFSGYRRWYWALAVFIVHFWDLRLLKNLFSVEQIIEMWSCFHLASVKFSWKILLLNFIPWQVWPWFDSLPFAILCFSSYVLASLSQFCSNIICISVHLGCNFPMIRWRIWSWFFAGKCGVGDPRDTVESILLWMIGHCHIYETSRFWTAEIERW